MVMVELGKGGDVGWGNRGSHGDVGWESRHVDVRTYACSTTLYFISLHGAALRRAAPRCATLHFYSLAVDGDKMVENDEGHGGYTKTIREVCKGVIRDHFNSLDRQVLRCMVSCVSGEGMFKKCLQKCRAGGAESGQ